MIRGRSHSLLRTVPATRDASRHEVWIRLRGTKREDVNCSVELLANTSIKESPLQKYSPLQRALVAGGRERGTATVWMEEGDLGGSSGRS